MLRWGLAVAWVLVLACGTRVDEPQGVTRTSGAVPAADGGIDAGTASCTTPGKLVASAGSGSPCGMKPVLGAPRTVKAPLNLGTPDGTESCGFIGPSDGAGDIIIETELATLAHGGFRIALNAFDSGGALLGQAEPDLSGAVAIPLRSGWLVEGSLVSPPNSISLYPPSLRAPVESFSADRVAVTSWTPGGGAAVVVVVPFDASCPHSFHLFATSFDGSAAAVFRDVSVGCGLSEGGNTVGRNAAGDVLVVAPGFGAGDLAWHVTPDGIVSQVPPSPVGSLYPLIDGRFANHSPFSSTGAGAWLSTLDVDGNVSPPPCWLASRPDVFAFQIVLGGQAYLAYHLSSAALPPVPQPCDRFAELVLSDGTSCGFIPLTGAQQCSSTTVSVGLDGTLTTLDTGTCTASFWPGVFR